MFEHVIGAHAAFGSCAAVGATDAVFELVARADGFTTFPITGR